MLSGLLGVRLLSGKSCGHGKDSRAIRSPSGLSRLLSLRSFERKSIGTFESVESNLDRLKIL